MKFYIVFLFFVIISLLSEITSAQNYYSPTSPTVVIHDYDKMAEAYDRRTREIKNYREAMEEHLAETRRVQAYEKAKAERREKVRRLRGK